MSKSSDLTGLELALEGCQNLVSVNLSKTSVTRLPDSIGHLPRLQVLNMNDCLKLQELPDSINQLTSLQELLLCGCESLVALPNFITRLRDHSYLYELTSEQIQHWPLPPNFNRAIEFDFSYYSQATEFGHVLKKQQVVFKGCVNKSIPRECSVVASPWSPVTKAMLRHSTVPLILYPIPSTD